MSWFAFVMLVLGFVAGVALLFTDKMRYFPVVAFVLVICAAIGYSVGVYDYVFNAAVGIDIKGVSAAFVANTVLFSALLVASVFNVCLKQDRAA